MAILPKDFKEFIELLNKNKAHYLIIGGYAYSFYAEPRFTKDIDILIEQSKKNAKKIINSIIDFGFSDLDITEKDFFESDQVIQLGVAPIRIDMMGFQIVDFSFLSL